MSKRRGWWEVCLVSLLAPRRQRAACLFAYFFGGLSAWLFEGWHAYFFQGLGAEALHASAACWKNFCPAPDKLPLSIYQGSGLLHTGEVGQRGSEEPVRHAEVQRHGCEGFTHRVSGHHSLFCDIPLHNLQQGACLPHKLTA